jgi:hypothetical protein
MDGAYAHLAACYKRTTDHCIAELNCSLSPGTWLKSSCRAGRFFQESLSRDYEESLKEDFEAWHKSGNSGAYRELELEAIKLIRPIGNQNKGQIARHIAQGLVSRYPGFKPRLGESIFQELKNLGLVKPSIAIEPPV